MQGNLTQVTELLNMLQEQSQVISSQSDMICKLTNENAEKENMINVLMSEM